MRWCKTGHPTWSIDMKRNWIFRSRLNGRFHGLVADRARGTAILFNDRFGLQRIYYHEAKDTFYFAAEAKAILKVRPELRNMDPRGLGEFIVCGCVLENRTLFPGYPCPASRLGVGVPGGKARKEERLLRASRMGRRRAAQARRLTTLIFVTFSCRICRAISMGRSASASRLPVDSTRASSWPGARLRPIPCHVIRSAACTATIRTCNWRGAWQKSAASNTRSSPPARSSWHDSRITRSAPSI